MFHKRTIKWLSVLAILGASSLSLYSTSIQAVSKVPILNPSSSLIEPVEPFETPEDYPEELTEWYDENMDARSYIVIDQATNKVLAQREGNMPYPIASMSKVLAVHLIFEAIDEGTLSLDQEIEIPSAIVEGISSNPELSNAWLVEDVSYPVEDLLYAVMMVSANDATSALMWEIYGNEQTAAQAMQDQLTEWNITNAQIYSVSGAPNSELPESMWMPGSNEMNENIMSAADVALMTKHIIEEHPEILDISSTIEYTFMEGTSEEQFYYTNIQLLEGGAYERPNVTGLKSGFTDAAGLNFVATGSQDDRNYIAVAMGTFGEGMSSYWEIEILLDGLLEYPDLYEMDLPTNLRELPDEVEIPEDTTSDDTEEVDVQEVPELENNRDNPLTNFMRDIFGVFN